MKKANTPVQLNEIVERLENSSDTQIGTLFEKITKRNPFKDPKNKLLLPSVIRAQCIEQIKKWYLSGDLIANK